MNIVKNCLMILLALMAHMSVADVFYSAGDGNWNNANTWSDTDGGVGGYGIPADDDTVIVRNGDVVTIPNLYTIGPLPGDIPFHSNSGSSVEHFIHNGKLTVRSGGTLQKTSGTRYVILAGETNIFGTIDFSDRLYNLGNMTIHSGATANVGNDLVLARMSSTVIHVDVSVADDIYFIGSDVTLCGTGSVTLGTDVEAMIREWNADAVNQMCAGFPIHNDGAEGNTTLGENSALPITLIVFKVVGDQLYWDVIEEEVWAFEVHYSADGNQWGKYGELRAHGTGRYQYCYPVKKAGFYRIMSVEELPEFSSIVYYTGIPSSVNVFPNVAKANEVISIVGEEIHKLEFISRSGQIMKTVIGKYDVVHLDLKPDLYYVRIYQPVSVTTRRLVVM